ncbi:hypothetical protein CMUS01_13628 [Colletotrichum musicola]|uniref:Uncharacterized protein n=1 Tax=Colletotrichum musicola TaxID=2175873 RepID=A0A8H6MUQ0_9PEZI|nr:hypothetical protein CMUS01_13628 [Colletotrichum musicola]
MFAADDNTNAHRLAVNNERHEHSSEWSAVHDDKMPNPPRVTFRLPDYSVGFLDNQPSTGDHTVVPYFALKRRLSSRLTAPKSNGPKRARREEFRAIKTPPTSLGRPRPRPSQPVSMARQASRICSSLVYERQAPRGTLPMLLSDASCAALELPEAAIANVPSVSCPVALAFSTRPALQPEDRQVVPPAVTSRLAGGPHNRRLWPVRRLARDPRRFCPRHARRGVKDPFSAPTDSSRMEGF